jgi:hypothetical protein
MRSRWFVVLGSTVLSSSCCMMDGDDLLIDRFDSAAQSLEARIAAHEEIVLAAGDTETVRRELDAYTAELEPLFREMNETCDRMMKEMVGGEISAEDYAAHTEFMMAAIREYVTAAKASPDIASMKQRWDEHQGRMRAISRHMKTMAEMMRMMS